MNHSIILTVGGLFRNANFEIVRESGNINQHILFRELDVQ